MASHLRNAHDLHARVFFGDEAREALIKHKRDSHGDAIKMNVPEGFVMNNKDVATTSVDALTTAVSVVYVTLPQTFSGSAVYSTLTGAPSATAPAVSAAQATDSSNSGFGASSSAVLVGGGASTGASIIAGAPLQATRSSSAAALATATGASASPSAFGSSSGSNSGISSGSNSGSSNGASSDSSSSYASTTTSSADDD